MYMRLIILADIDEFKWQWEEGQADLVISCGDVSDQLVFEAAQAFHCSKIFAVKGNHDSNTPFPEPIIDLHLKAEEFNGVTFGGLNGSWKYKPRGPFLYEQEEVEGFLSDFPAVDALVSHNSPRGVHDQEDEVHYGFEALNRYIERAKPRFLIHGHQHVNKETELDGTKVVGLRGIKVLEI